MGTLDLQLALVVSNLRQGLTTQPTPINNLFKLKILRLAASILKDRANHQFLFQLIRLAIDHKPLY
jgi:hypothetical protein